MTYRIAITTDLIKNQQAIQSRARKECNPVSAFESVAP